jgi:hypothetical protein
MGCEGAPNNIFVPDGTAKRLILSPNDRDEQIAAMDSQLRWTLPRFCSIAWFGLFVWGKQHLGTAPWAIATCHHQTLICGERTTACLALQTSIRKKQKPRNHRKSQHASEHENDGN